MNFSYISHDLKISEIHLFYERLFFSFDQNSEHRECFALLLGSGGKGRPATVLLSSVTHVSLIFHLRGNC